MNITEKIQITLGYNKCPNYADFYKAYISAFRELHPQSALPSDLLLSIFYDDYCNNMIVPSY